MKRDEFLFVTSPFGMRQDPMDKSKQQMHKGIYIRAKHDDVLATENGGKVVAVNHNTNTGGGKSVTVEYARSDGSKVQTTYMHLDSIVVKVGDEVKAGQKLGVSGNTGTRTTGEHLRVQAFQADGAAQDFFVVDDDRVAKLPEGMSLDYGAMIEPSAVGAHASNRTDVKGKNVVVSGAGTIGNLIAQFCVARGAKNVLITDVSDLRLAKARECGIKHTLNITKKTLKEAAQELFGEEGYQVGFEVAGVEVSIRSLMETIEKGSDIVVVAVFAKDPVLSMFYLGEHELRLIGSMMYRHEDYLTAIDYVSKGIVNLKPLVSNRFAFEEYDDAYKFIDTHRETSMKVLIDFEQKPGEKK